MNHVSFEKKWYYFEFIIVFFLILFDMYVVLHFSFAKVSMNSPNFIMLLQNTAEHLQTEPFELHLNNEKVLNEFILTQKKLFFLYILLILMIFAKTKNQFKGIEYGSAGFGSSKDKKQFKKSTGNIVLSNDLFLDVATKQYNLNQLVIGGLVQGKPITK